MARKLTAQADRLIVQAPLQQGFRFASTESADSANGAFTGRPWARIDGCRALLRLAKRQTPYHDAIGVVSPPLRHAFEADLGEQPSPTDPTSAACTTL